MDFRPRTIQEDDAPISLVTEEGKDLPVTMHDADTLYTDRGVGQRLLKVKAAEVPKITPIDGFSPGSSLGVAQTKATKSLMNQYGYNRQVVTGTDMFGRQLVDIQTKQGDSYGDFLIQHGITQPDNYTSDEALTKRSIQGFQDAMLQHVAKTPVQKAREIVDFSLSQGTTIARPRADTVEEFQDYTSATSNKGLGQQEKDIKALEARLLSPEITSLQKAGIQKKLNLAKESYQSNLNAPQGLYMNSVEGSNMYSSGELGRAWDTGWVGVEDSAAGMLSYLGDVFESKTLKNEGKDWSILNQRKRRNIDLTVGDRDVTGGTLTTLDDVEQDFSKVFQYIGTSTLQYGPQMAVMIGGSAAGGALAGVLGPVAGALGASVVPMAMGISDVYSEMPEDEKDPLLATAVGAAVGLVDKMGFSKGAIRGVDLLTKEGIEKVANKIAVSKNISVKEATTVLHKEVLKMGKDYAEVVKAVAKDQLKSKENLIGLLGEITKRGGKEAATEAVQEAMQYSAIREGTSLDFNWSELHDRVKESAIVGGILGANLSTPGAMYDRSNFNHQLNLLSGIESRPRTNTSLMEQEEIARNGHKLDDIQLAGSLRNYASSTGKNLSSIDDLIQPGTQRNTLWKDFKSLLTNGGLFSQTRDNNLAPYTLFQGGRELAGLFDANSVRGVYEGMSPFKRIHAIANSAMSLLPGAAALRKMFNTDNAKDIGTIVMDSLNNNNHAGARAYRAHLDEMGGALADSLDSLGYSTGWNSAEVRSPDFFLKNQIVDPNLVRASEQDFIDALNKHYVPSGIMPSKLDTAFVADLVNRIKSDFTHREMTDLKSLGVLNNPAFNKFRSKDLEHNATRMVEMISRGAVRNTIFGAQGEVVANGIQKMIDKGEITSAEGSQLAMNLKEMIEAFDGRLNQSTSPLIRGATENLTFATMMVYMDTSLFANLAEIAYGALGLSPKNMVKYFGLTAKEFAKDIAAKFTQAGSKLTGGVIHKQTETDLSKNQSLIQHTGHAGKMNDIAFNVGANLNTQAKRNLSKLMFKFNMVESAVNASRAARGAIAADEINNLVSIIAESPNDNDTTRWARDRLSYYRMNPDEMVSIYKAVGQISIDRLNSMNPSDPLYAKLGTQLTNGITNFIDEFSSRPEPGSTAKIFDDHRFALFTQFKKFTWHFSSNVVPQLWKMYIARGTPQYTYSAFSMLMLSFALAYSGMYLKSLLRGEEQEDDESKLTKRLKQAFDYSMGAAPADLYNMASGATATRADGTLKNSPLQTFVGLSPSLNLAKSTGADIYKIATKEDDSKQKSNLIRRIPVFGEIPALRDMYSKE